MLELSLIVAKVMNEARNQEKIVLQMILKGEDKWNLKA